jgi:hypothetical protein
MKMKKTHEELEQYDEWDEDYILETSPNYTVAIGTFVLAFSSLEHSVNLALAEEINDRGHLPGYQIIELLTTRDKIDLLTRMMGAHLYHTEKNKKNSPN